MHRPAFTTTPLGAWQPAAAPTTPARLWAARLLRRAGAVLRHSAHRLARPVGARRSAAVPQTLPQIEFYAEAGAPEGALYVDGQYVGQVGVSRL